MVVRVTPPGCGCRAGSHQCHWCGGLGASLRYPCVVICDNRWTKRYRNAGLTVLYRDPGVMRYLSPRRVVYLWDLSQMVLRERDIMV